MCIVKSHKKWVSKARFMRNAQFSSYFCLLTNTKVYQKNSLKMQIEFITWWTVKKERKKKTSNWESKRGKKRSGCIWCRKKARQTTGRIKNDECLKWICFNEVQSTVEISSLLLVVTVWEMSSRIKKQIVIPQHNWMICIFNSKFITLNVL